MASTILVKEALWRVSVLLQDHAPQFIRWTERELVDWLNDGQSVIATYLPSSAARRDAIRLQMGTRQSIELIEAADCKPGDGSTPTDPVLGNALIAVHRNMGANGTTPGRAVRMVERRTLDAQTPDWHFAASGKVVSQFMFDPQLPRYFDVTPPLSERTWVEVAFTAQPVRIPAGGAPGAEVYPVGITTGPGATARLSIGDENLPDLVSYVVARAHLKQVAHADSSLAGAYSGAFLGSLNARIAATTGVNPNLKLLPLAPSPPAQASR